MKKKLCTLMLAVVLCLSIMPANVANAGVTASPNETTIYNFLKREMGLNTAAACGVLANIYHESRFNPNASGDSGTSYGICQWHNQRWTNLQNWCDEKGYDWETLTGQLYFLKFELSQNSSSYLYNGKTIFNNISAVENTAEGAYEAARYWCLYYEIPANKEAVSKKRGELARDTYWAYYSTQNGIIEETPENDSGDITEDNTEDILPDISAFTDVSVNAWYYDEVSSILNTGLMKGTGSTTFEPEEKMNRAQMAQILYRMNGEPETEYDDIFTDVTYNKWYAKAAVWAGQSGVVNGYENGTFLPMTEISREQIATMLYRYADYMGYNVSAAADLSGYTDAGSVSNYAKQAMQWVVAKDIIKGKTTTTLEPQGVASRAECATIMIRFMDQYNLR